MYLYLDLFTYHHQHWKHHRKWASSEKPTGLRPTRTSRQGGYPVSYGNVAL